MKRFQITEYRHEARLKKLGAYFNADVSNDCDDHFIKFGNKGNEGTIRGINFDDGVSLMMFDMTLSSDIELEFDLGRRHPVLFLYAHKGNIELTSVDNDIHHSLRANDAIIYSPHGSSTYKIKFPAKEKIQCVFVSVIRFLFLRKVECDLDTIPEPLQEMFKDTIGKKSFYYKTISEPIDIIALSQILKTEQQGLERKLLVEAKSLKLITALIKRFRTEGSSLESNFRFSKKDIHLINKAKNYLIDNIDRTPPVKEISQAVGLSSNKLQKGFKMLFGKSIRQFTITLKMHLAMNFLDIGEFTISEIAYKVGYTNKGHFSQLFKKEFGLLPSEYQIRIPLASRQK